MSCTVMYQPYAMSYSSCDRSSAEKKIFKFPHAPSPPDSSHSDASTYSSPGPSTGGSIGIGPPPLPPPSIVPSSLSLSLSSGSSLSSHSLNLSHNSLSSSHSLSSHGGIGLGGGGGHHSSIVSLPATISRRPLTPIPLTPSSSSSLSLAAAAAGSSHNLPIIPPVTGGISIPSASATLSSSSSNRSSSSTSHNNPDHHHHHHHHHHGGSSHHNNNNSNHTTTSHTANNSSSSSSSHSQSNNSTSHHSSDSLSSSHRAHYLSANSVVFVHYNGDASRVVDEHFSRALSAAYTTSTEKSSKSTTPMSTRNFPPSFWNSNYQPSKPLTSYGAATAADFYGTAVDYGPAIPSLAHHHQPDPWHYPLPTHQSYHHRPADIPYPAMPSTSRFNAAQYGSFLLAGAAASTGAGRFPGMGPHGQCGMKEATGPWAGSRYHHESLSDLHLADYSAAAAAHYSNMTAGLETTVQDSSKDLYWF